MQDIYRLHSTVASKMPLIVYFMRPLNYKETRLEEGLCSISRETQKGYVIIS
jgi:hypothetical protein